MTYNQWNGDIGIATLEPKPMFLELYYPLWWYSGSYISTTSTGTLVLIGKGATGTTALASATSANHLFTLSSNADPNNDYAIEFAGYVSNAVDNVFVVLWDFTLGSSVTSSDMISSATSMTVSRSGRFKLTPGHVYGIAIDLNNTAGYTGYVTDVSLIIFPPTSSISPSLSSVSLMNPSGNTLKESYIPLWCMSSGTANTTNYSPTTFLQKGSIPPAGNTTASELYVVNTNWSQSQNFTFEASIYATSGYTAHASLVDLNGLSVVTGSQISTTSTTATLIRSSTFTLTIGHTYLVTLFSSTNGQSAYLTKAHLVALANS